MSIYFFIAQIFNIPEPIRNRPGTGILGFDIQTTFWSSGSHRMLGTFREPVFLVSLLFPSFIVLHYKSKNNLSFFQGCVVKYVCRYLKKDKIKDLEKIIHYCELEILKLKDTRNKK